MGFLSFGSKKGKIKKLIEEERFDEIVPMVVKDKKALNALIELLDDPAPGIRGDVLLLLGNVVEQRSDVIESRVGTIFPKAIELTKDRNPYVRENAMVLSYELARRFPGAMRGLNDSIVNTVMEELRDGDKNTKGFILMLLGELGSSEARKYLGDLIEGVRGYVEELVDVEDKVILPFEGKKWVPLGEIAKETLEKLS